jgi:hypothetical protein
MVQGHRYVVRRRAQFIACVMAADTRRREILRSYLTTVNLDGNHALTDRYGEDLQNKLHVFKHNCFL